MPKTGKRLGNVGAHKISSVCFRLYGGYFMYEEDEHCGLSSSIYEDALNNAANTE